MAKFTNQQRLETLEENEEFHQKIIFSDEWLC